MTSHGHGNPARHHQSRGLGDLANAGQAASANPQRPIVLAVALGLALCLPIGWATEFSVRRFVPIQGVLYRQHARLLYEHIPNSRKRFHHPPEDGSGSLLVTINAHGFRAGHFRESSSRRVLVIGDSFVSAEYSPESESFVYRLADQLRRTGPSADVVNAGVTGYGPDQSLLWLEDNIAQLRPDLIVLGIFGANDYGDLFRNKIFELDGHGLETRAYGFDAGLAAQFREVETRSSVHLVRAAIFLWSQLFSRPTGAPSVESWTSRSMVEGWYNERLVEYRDYWASDRVAELFDDDYEADLSVAPDAESSVYKARLMRAILARLKRVAESHGSKLLLVNIPSAVDACDAYPVQVERSVYPEYERTALTDVTEGLARDLGIQNINLFSTLRTSACSDYYYVAPLSNTHWNAHGQAKSAIEVGRYIVDRELL